MMATRGSKFSARSRNRQGCSLGRTILFWIAVWVPSVGLTMDHPPIIDGQNYVGFGAGLFDAEVNGQGAHPSVFARYFYGRRVSENSSIEFALGRYKDFGRRHRDLAGTESGQAHAWVADVSMGRSYSITRRLALYARLGWSLQHTSVDGPSSASTSNQPVATIGMTIGLYDDAPVRLEFGHLKGNRALRDINQFSLQIVHVLR